MTGEEVSPGRLRLKGLGIGAAVGLAVAAVMTWNQWRLNPGGVFRDAGATDWGIARETFLSWFLPVFLLSAALAVGALYLLARRR